MNKYALILAGGSGTRFWPLSRDHRPKQLLNMFGEGTLLRQAIDRLDGLVPRQNIFILTNQLQEAEVLRQAHDLLADNIISEPVRRDTAPAIALGIGLIKAMDPHGVMLVIPSDQLIQDQVAFRTLMKAAMDTAAQEKALVTVGIKPTWPCPSYGYIEHGKKIDSAPGSPCREVIQFREKPDPATAAAYLDQGNFCWNAGMFVWSISTVCEQLDKHCPELASFVEHIVESPDPQETIREEFPELTPISIDFALMEHADRVLNFEATFDWDDVGSWISVSNYLENHSKNTTNTDITVQDSSGNIVFSQRGDKHVALLGVDNLIVVETADAILIADKNKADEIKKIVNQLPDELR
ncbi:sugar phosphate nucleotidyltransferase [uncultured Akkermansia sp.]|uniref:mannose-1-phosphate guanylyltransferase n=1 Tax=uncultured Akkermansia sp. TaxID=512294 RepID=UPI00265D1DD0|nr:sugar phosphate nucleotidyltransferase [uncultured Akkermansia sp.]